MTNRERCINFIAKHPDIKTVIVSREAGEELTDLYYRLTGRIVSCSGCAHEAMVAHSSILKYIERDSNPDHIFNKNKVMTNYKLKNGVLAYCQGTNRHYTNESMTDEVGAMLLSENENNVNLFDEFPSDYQKDIEALKAKKVDVIEVEHEQEEVKNEVAEETSTLEIQEKPIEAVKEKSRFPKRK